MFGTNQLRKQEKSDGTMLYIQSIFSTIQGEGPFSGEPAIFLRLSGCNLRCMFCDTDFESKRREMNYKEIVAEIVQQSVEGKQRKTKLVVITGGEPMIQNIFPLVQRLVSPAMGYKVQIETAGTVWVDKLEEFVCSGVLTIVCSPKTGKVHPKIEQYCYDWKYLIREGEVSPGDGLPMKSTQQPEMDLKLFRPLFGPFTTNVWLQPCEEFIVGYKKVHLPNDGTEALDGTGRKDGLADQAITSSVRDEAKTKRNIQLATELAMKFNYRISLQLHKVLGLP